MAAARVRVSAGGKGGGEGEQGDGVLLILAAARGGSGREARVSDTAAPRHWRHAVRAVATVMDVFRKKTPDPFSLFANRSSQHFSEFS